MRTTTARQDSKYFDVASDRARSWWTQAQGAREDHSQFRAVPVLFTFPSLLGGGLAALAAAGRVAQLVFTQGGSGLFNDFYDYWGAARLLNQRRDPYDINALTRVVHDAGLHPEVGSGYSYPVLFAQLMRPLALLPPRTSALLFSIVSLAALIFAVALLLESLPRLNWPTALIGGALAGVFPPVTGSLYFGQANLLVLPLLAIAFRKLWPEPLTAVAAAVKLYPVTGVLAGLMQRRLPWMRLTASGLVLLALLVVPGAAATRTLSTRTWSYIGTDPFWSNQSINGAVSRLGLPSPWTTPPLPGLPVEMVTLTVAAMVSVGTVLVLLLARGRPWEGCFSLSLWLGVVVAPKNSLWNFTPLLFCFAFAWMRSRGRWPVLVPCAMGWLLIEVQAHLDGYRDTVYRTSTALTWLSSLGLYGALIVGGVIAYLLLRPSPPRLPPSSPSSTVRELLCGWLLSI
jgi:hypothetical protein